jgi:protein O-GlcNAc transferase
MSIAELLELGLARHREGKLGEAEQLYRQILQADPNHFQAWHLLGALAYQVGAHAGAIDCLTRAIAINPASGEVRNSLGVALRAAGRLDEARTCLEEAVRLMPEFSGGLHNLGLVLTEQKRYREAEECFRRAIRIKPDYAEAHYALGNALRPQGNSDEAIACYRQAIALQPNHARAMNNLGYALKTLGRLDEALASIEQALHIEPNSSVSHNNLGTVLHQQRRFDEAVASYQKALALDPNDAEIHSNLAAAWHELRSLDDAVVHLREAIRLQPNYTEAYNNLGLTLKEQGRLSQASEAFRHALSLDPQYVLAQSNLVLTLNHDPAIDAETLFQEHCRWGELHGLPKVTVAKPTNAADIDRPLRVGYVSPHFNVSPEAPFVEPVLMHHDPRQVETVLYSQVHAPDAVTERLRNLAGTWRDTCGLTDEQMVDLVRADQIDILVDLAGHTANNRLLVFAQHPAPVQVTWLGYCHTTGLPAIDYRITDQTADPPGEPIRHVEELVRLPGCFCCYLPPGNAPDVGPLPALQSGWITFGSLHKLAKLNPQVLDLWSRLLQALPESRLLVFRDTLKASTAEFFRQELLQRGILADRFELRHEVPKPGGHLSVYADIDISLDVFPWSGHATVCESLWMGVPMVTLRGTRHAGRMVASVLSQAGLSDWIAETPEKYVEVAVRAARDLTSLAELRTNLRRRLQESPLCDGAAFTRSLEEAYRAMWKRTVLSS